MVFFDSFLTAGGTVSVCLFGSVFLTDITIVSFCPDGEFVYYKKKKPLKIR
jgi:hypothetical protein